MNWICKVFGHKEKFVGGQGDRFSAGKCLRCGTVSLYFVSPEAQKAYEAQERDWWMAQAKEFMSIYSKELHDLPDDPKSPKQP